MGALYGDHQDVDLITEAVLVLTHFEHRRPPCYEHLSACHFRCIRSCAISSMVASYVSYSPQKCPREQSSIIALVHYPCSTAHWR